MEGLVVLMDLDELVAKYEMDVTGIIHGGAHLAEEAADYNRIFGDDVAVCWIEANPNVKDKIHEALRPYQSQILVMGCLWHTDGQQLTFNITNYDGMSSSVYEFGTHPEFSPDTVFVDKIQVETVTLDTVAFNLSTTSWPVNMLVLDLQGAELAALEGAKELLPRLDYVMSEVNTEEVYTGCSKVWDLDDILLKNGMKRVEAHWVEGQGWGDALWLRH